MSVKQFMAMSRQTVRHQLDAVPAYLFYPTQGKLEPDPEFKEEAVTEWRGADTAQGVVSDDRTSTSFKHAWESRIYPGAELDMLLEFLNGLAAAPVNLVDPNAAAQRVIYQSASEMYGDGSTLEDQAIAMIPHTGKAGSTYSQPFIGGRPKDAEFSFKGGEAAILKINVMGGPWIGAPEQAPIAGETFPAAKAFKSVPKLYLGSGAALTGTVPNYTDFSVGTMLAAKPDDLTIKIDTGQDDVFKMNGYDGPSETERKGAIKDTMEFTIDFADPASGWSSYDAWKARFSGIEYVPVMVTLDGPEVIPSCSDQKFHLAFYWPKMKLTFAPVDRKSDGTKEKVKVTLEHRIDTAVNVARYMKLIY